MTEPTTPKNLLSKAQRRRGAAAIAAKDLLTTGSTGIFGSNQRPAVDATDLVSDIIVLAEWILGVDAKFVETASVQPGVLIVSGEPKELAAEIGARLARGEKIIEEEPDDGVISLDKLVDFERGAAYEGLFAEGGIVESKGETRLIGEEPAPCPCPACANRRARG